MKYLLHDTNALSDEKMTLLQLKFGYEGVGLFWSILEKIGMQEKPINTVVLKAQLNVGKKLEKVWQYLEEIELISSQNGETFNERILSYSETYQIKNEKTKERVSKWRENQKNKKDVTRNECVSNDPKVKESKVNGSKVNNRAKALVNSGELTRQNDRELSKKYDEIAKNLTGKKPVEIWTTVKTFIEENKPAFPEPYADLWNVFAESYKLSKIENISNSRLQKFSTRIREHPFDFIRILDGIKKSLYLKGENDRGWKANFDFIVDNDKNYLKIIEGQYN